ncbi:hypothetical protein SDC9_155233 [bioreactor metagenome]|uniref:Endonuclease/exonuclease/phosphatase domain-containing protein n=1 Tax=bioreactor metagenome TaxID=1076179 RepID=A0A645F0V7_9ZZZZ
MSKYPIKSALTYPVEDTYYDKLNHYESRVIMKSEILLPGSDDQILSVFISHFGYQSPAEAKNGIKLLKSLTAQVQVPFVFMGDLNNTPDSPALAPLFDMLDDTIKLAGAAAAQKPSFPSDNPKEKIDYIFVSHGLRCVNADIPLDAIASDHLPHIAEIEI